MTPELQIRSTPLKITMILHTLYASLRGKLHTVSFWLECLLLFLFTLSFAPIFNWYAQNTAHEVRLLHSLITLAIAVVILIHEETITLKNELKLNKHCKNCLLISLFLLAFYCITNYFFGTEGAIYNQLEFFKLILLTASFTFAVASLIFFVFGTAVSKITYSSTITLIIFLLFSVLMGFSDWPLRTLALTWSVQFFDLLGLSVNSYLLNDANTSPALIIEYSGQRFNVASECNGFGIILNGLLIGSLLSVYSKQGFINTICNVAAALFIGFTLNILRIVSIILVAPYSMNVYDLVHELIGTTYYWGAFILTWYLLYGSILKKKN